MTGQESIECLSFPRQMLGVGFIYLFIKYSVWTYYAHTRPLTQKGAAPYSHYDHDKKYIL